MMACLEKGSGAIRLNDLIRGVQCWLGNCLTITGGEELREGGLCTVVPYRGGESEADRVCVWGLSPIAGHFLGGV